MLLKQESTGTRGTFWITADGLSSSYAHVQTDESRAWKWTRAHRFLLLGLLKELQRFLCERGR